MKRYSRIHEALIRCVWLAMLPLLIVACAQPFIDLNQIPWPLLRRNVEVVAALDEPFVLHVGDTALVADGTVRVHFNAVSEDSRCPSQVNCFWIGRAVIDLAVTVGDGAAESVEVSTIHSPEPTDLAEVQGYVVELVDVSPYPKSPDAPIQSGAYAVTFSIHQDTAVQ